MKKLMLALLLSAPVAAHAMGGWGGGYRCGSCGHLAAFLYALMAALGYWVLQHAIKQEAPCACVKHAGRAVGWTLAVIGLLGTLCAVAGHVRKYTSCATRCEVYGGAGGPGGGRMAIFKASEGGAEWDMKVDEEAGKGGERVVKVRLQSDKKAK